jgi:CRP/FNR family transcriptional regulator, cyclic AMP receptor protein
MSLDASRSAARRLSQWPLRADRARDGEFPATHCYLLDADDDLSAAFDLRMRLAARQVVTAAVFDTPAGECELDPWFAAAEHGPGLLVLEGVIAIDARVGDRTASELVGSGDLLQPTIRSPEDILEHVASWRVLRPAKLAVLDGGFAERARPWPQITQELLRRVGRRAADLDVLRAIASQPRLEVRLVLVLWHFARRWGRVEHGGIHLCLPLTHRLLGQIIGAERPSVSHALARLSRAGLVTGGADDLHLNGTVEEHLWQLMEPVAQADRHGRAKRLERTDAAS